MDRQMQPVAVFWDFENCALHNRAGGWEVDNIRRVAQEYGPIKIFKAYLEISARASPETLNLRSELQSCGVSLTDCPHNGRKDVADKMMLVDMLTFALDTEAPATIILLSGDRDFVYALSVLRLRGYRTVVIAPKHSHANFRFRASEVLDWDTLIVRKQDAPRGRRPSDIAEPRPNIDTSQGGPICAPSPSGSSLLSPFLDISRRSSFKDDRTAAPPRPSHGRASSEQLPQTSWPPATAKPSSPSKAGRVILDLAASESALDDTEDLLFSPGTSNLPSTDNESSDVSFVDAATNLCTSELCNDSPTPREAPCKPSAEHAGTDRPLANVSQSHAIGDPSVPPPQPAVVVRAETVQPVVSQPVPPPAQVITLHVPPYQPTTPLALSSAPPATDNLTQSQSTSLPAKQSIPPCASALGAAVPGSSKPILLTSQSIPVNTNADTETVSSSEIQGATHFLLMIYILDEHRRAGTPQVLRTTLAPRLVQHDPNAYIKAGFTKFKSYITLAQKNGIVELGGVDALAWVSLRPKWYGRGQAPRG